MQRIPMISGLAIAVLLAGTGTVRAGCTTTVNEAATPIVFTNMNTTDTGFASYYWAWGTSDSSGIIDQDGDTADLSDNGSGIAVAPGIDWQNSSRCSTNPTTTALLIVSETADSGGKFALCVGSQNNGSNVDLDKYQNSDEQSQAAYIPSISINSASTGNDGNAYTEYSISWTAPSSTAWAVNDQSGDVQAGYALYYRTGSTDNTGNKSGWTRLTGSASGTTPYITNDASTNDTTDGYLPTSQTSATIRVYGSDTFYFALALRFDGTGASTGTDREAAVTAVETSVVGPSSNGAVGPMAAVLAGFAAKQTGDSTVTLSWSTASENGVMGFRLSRDTTGRGQWRSLTTVPAAGPGGAGTSYSYVDELEASTRRVSYLLEVVGTDGNVLETRQATVRLRISVTPPQTGEEGLEFQSSGDKREPQPPQ